MEKQQRYSSIRKKAGQQVTFIIPLEKNMPSPEDDTQMASLALRYADGGEWTTDSPELKLLFSDNGYYLNKLPYQIVSDSDIDQRARIGQLTVRRSSDQSVSAANQICRMYDMMVDGDVVVM